MKSDKISKLLSKYSICFQNASKCCTCLRDNNAMSERGCLSRISTALVGLDFPCTYGVEAYVFNDRLQI